MSEPVEPDEGPTAKIKRERPTAQVAPVSHTRRNVIIAIVVVLVGGGAAFFFTHRAADKKAQTSKGPPERKVPVLVEEVEQRDVPIVLEGLGTVTPLATVQVRSQVDGRLMSVAFKEGQPVKKGEQIALIDPRPFQIQVKQMESTLQRDAALLRNARLLLERNKQLKEQDLVAQQNVDDQQTVVDQLVGTAGIDQAALDSAKLQLEYAHVISPVDGVVGIRQVDVGNLIRASDATGLVTVTQLDPISVIFTVPQDELDRLQAAMHGETPPVEAWSRESTTLLARGQLTVIDNQVNATTGTVRLRAMFENPKRALWPNQFVKARLTVEEKKNATTINAAAIQRGPQGAFVYLAKDDNTAELRKVEVELITGQLALIKSGLEKGDKVITDGQAQLKPGSLIEVRGRGEVAKAQ